MRKYDVAISFAGEDRKIAHELASNLRSLGLKIFYDKYAQAELWGKDLYTHLSKVYKDDATFCLMLLSVHYAKKQWTNHERAAAQVRAFQENEEYILPLKLDDTQIDGILPTTGYMDYRKTSLDEVVGAIVEKVREFRQPSQTLYAGDDGTDYWHDDTQNLEKWTVDLEEQRKEAESEADHAQAQDFALVGPYHAANEEVAALTSEIEHMRKIIERVNAGFPYFEAFGFEAAIDACGEVAIWREFGAIVAPSSTDQHEDHPIRIPLEAQKDYAAAVDTRLFDGFELCTCFEPPDDTLGVTEVRPVDHFLFGTIGAVHTENKRKEIFLVSAWRGNSA